MAKINLKTANPLTLIDTSKTEKLEEEPFVSKKLPERKENIDLSFTSTESFFDKAEPQTEAKDSNESFLIEEEQPETEEEETLQRGTYAVQEDEFNIFKSTLSVKKPFFIFGSIVLLLLLIIFIVYQLTKSGEEVATTKELPKQPLSTQLSETQTIKSKEVVLLPIYQQNLNSNRFLKNNLQNFINQKPGSADFSLIVMTPTDINLTILADSRDQIARFHMDLKKAFPSFGFRIIAVQPKSNKKIYADLSARVNPPKTVAPKPVSEIKALTTKNIANEFQSVAKKYGVQIQYFKKGNITNRITYSETVYYAYLNGRKENLLNFIGNLVESFPMIKINKFSIYPYNLEIITDNNLSTRLIFTYYSAK